MKLGVFTPVLYGQPLEKALEYLHSRGVQMAEIGVGGNPGDTHCKPKELLADSAKLAAFQELFRKNEIEISALSAHGNPIHPNPELAAMYDDAITDAILLAEKLGLHQINTFSGCPGDHPGAKYPNWVVCPWPEDFLKVLEYQWNDVLIPYWEKKAAFAREHGVNQIALELHPGFCVYNTESLLKLRAAVGPEIGANLDPSHLIWQGMDPVMVIRTLGEAIFHFHAKDTKVDPYNTAVNGVLDTKHYSDEAHRSWIFRSVGYGLDYNKWKEIMSALRLVGYDYAISIEHEDGLMSPGEGLNKAIDFLKEVMIFEEKGTMWWA
ncbi:MAG TPA: sugar phosphate isomerase/epimerase [Candidatus Faecimorpha stercoravium]|jgi:sugar phosphate isomerase/epimerase|nr:sugar phosphate isomerase/epimerase [Candidatus Faecimorpha stercoravium]